MPARKKKPVSRRGNTPEPAVSGRWVPPTDTPAEVYMLIGRTINDLNNLVDHINPLIEEGCTVTVYLEGDRWEEINAPISHFTIHRQ